jgi:hypothetical protein
MTTSTNGRTERKSLASQLDRLDTILDGLADGLNEAVAAAVKAAVVVAVEAAVRELLASAELQRRLHPETTAKPGFFRRAASVVCRGAVSLAKGCWSSAVSLVSHCTVKTTETISVLREGGVVVVGRVRRGMTAFARQVWLGGFAAAGVARRWGAGQGMDEPPRCGPDCFLTQPSSARQWAGLPDRCPASRGQPALAVTAGCRSRESGPRRAAGARDGRRGDRVPAGPLGRLGRPGADERRVRRVAGDPTDARWQPAEPAGCGRPGPPSRSWDRVASWGGLGCCAGSFGCRFKPQ